MKHAVSSQSFAQPHSGPATLRFASLGTRPRTPENALGLDLDAEIGALNAALAPTGMVGGIVDIHNHVNGSMAPEIYERVMHASGVAQCFTMVRLGEAIGVREVFRAAGRARGIAHDRVHFIAFPNFREQDRLHALTEGFLEDIAGFHAQVGARFIKLWSAPRLYEVLPKDVIPRVVPFDAEWRVRHVELAQQLGMGVMVHIADPDTWFATRYADRSVFPAKIEQYAGLERMLDRYAGPWIAAHMGGWPEDLDFLGTLLSRHPNLWLDTSATKWIVRELSRHPASKTRAFLERWQGRICFGSDIVTVDEHLRHTQAAATGHPMSDLADSPERAHDLYLSRYVALRSMFERSGDTPSPIADPDLRMVDPTMTDPLASPTLRGVGLAPEQLWWLYCGAAQALLRGVGLSLPGVPSTLGARA